MRALSRQRSSATGGIWSGALAARTKDGYVQHVRAYGAWLGGRGDGEDALSDPRARDYAARDFNDTSKVDRGWKPSSVNLALAAVDHFNRFLGLGRRTSSASRSPRRRRGRFRRMSSGRCCARHRRPGLGTGRS